MAGTHGSARGEPGNRFPYRNREIVQALDMRGRLTAADALHTRAETTKASVDCGGHDRLTTKGNRPGLLAALAGPQWERCEALEKMQAGHGRIERREIRVVEANGRGPDGRLVPWLKFLGARVAARVVLAVRDKKTGAARRDRTTVPGPSSHRAPAVHRGCRGRFLPQPRSPGHSPQSANCTLEVSADDGHRAGTKSAG